MLYKLSKKGGVSVYAGSICQPIYVCLGADREAQDGGGGVIDNSS